MLGEHDSLPIMCVQDKTVDPWGVCLYACMHAHMEVGRDALRVVLGILYLEFGEIYGLSRAVDGQMFPAGWLVSLFLSPSLLLLFLPCWSTLCHRGWLQTCGPLPLAFEVQELQLCATCLALVCFELSTFFYPHLLFLH